MHTQQSEECGKHCEAMANGAETAKQLAHEMLELGHAALRRLSREIRELDAVIRADYDELAALPSAGAMSGAVELTGSARHSLERCWQGGGNARWTPSQPGEWREIALHAAPYTAGAGLGLWGFSCAMKQAESLSFVIYLNTAHLPGAVAITAAHELGHYLQHSKLTNAGDVAFAPMAANFAAHLNDPAELYADSAAALAAFDSDAASQLNARGGGPIEETVAAARELTDPRFRIDFASAAINPRWRVRYLTASIHFARLRAALHRRTGN